MKYVLSLTMLLIVNSSALAQAVDECGGCPRGYVCLTSDGIPLKRRCVSSRVVRNLQKIIRDLGTDFSVPSEAGGKMSIKVGPGQ